VIIYELINVNNILVIRYLIYMYVMNAFMHLVDDHLVSSIGILHIHVIF